jgi:hypothetical protein
LRIMKSAAPRLHSPPSGRQRVAGWSQGGRPGAISNRSRPARDQTGGPAVARPGRPQAVAARPSSEADGHTPPGVAFGALPAATRAGRRRPPARGGVGRRRPHCVQFGTAGRAASPPPCLPAKSRRSGRCHPRGVRWGRDRARLLAARFGTQSGAKWRAQSRAPIKPTRRRACARRPAAPSRPQRPSAHLPSAQADKLYRVRACWGTPRAWRGVAAAALKTPTGGDAGPQWVARGRGE